MLKQTVKLSKAEVKEEITVIEKAITDVRIFGDNALLDALERRLAVLKAM